MRNFLCFVFALCFSFIQMHGQGWIDIGFKGGGGLGMMYNENLWNDRSVEISFKGSNLYGGKVGINFNELHAITVDFLTSKTQQTYKMFTPNGDFSLNYAYKSFDIPVLYRYNSEYGSYMEVGGQLSKIKSVSETGRPTAMVDPQSHMVEKFYGVIFGFGSYMLGTNNLYLTAGFRFMYGVNDLISPAGGKNNLQYYPYAASYTPDPAYLEYKQTHPFTINFILEINYDLGYIVSSNCNRQAVILF